MKIKDLLQLSKLSQRDKVILIAHLLNLKVGEVYLKQDMPVSPHIVKRFLHLSSKVEKGYPLQYAIGEWDFFGRTFKVQEGVLIPRPETEMLVEKVLEKIDNKQKLGYEIGVGSGCISVTLLLERPHLIMHACDINPKAIELSMQNAIVHRVKERLNLYLGSLFEPVKNMRFDFIVSNPPYIPVSFWDKLEYGVRLEGYYSLIGGEKGYEFYEKIAEEIGMYLKDEGFFAFEIGHDQGKVVQEIFASAGFKTKVYKDYNSQDRVILGWKL